MFQDIATAERVHTGDGINAIRRLPVSPINRTQTKRDVQARQRLWLREVLEATGLKPAQVATGAGTSTSTLTRFLNDESYKGILAPDTVERIKNKYNVPGPEELSAARRTPLIGLSEAARLDTRKEKNELAQIVGSILRGRPNVEAWRLKTMALESVGYLPGDIVFVQILGENEMPKQQDAVCAQVVDYQHGAAETVWRVYDAPFLVGAGQDRTAYKPLLVDGERVKIVGVIRESYRPHPLSATR